MSGGGGTGLDVRGKAYSRWGGAWMGGRGRITKMFSVGKALGKKGRLGVVNAE
jgi:hypothetical protein